MKKSQKHIVIIEDDPVLRQLTEMAFSLEGYKVDLFENGKQGVAYLEQNLQTVDLILLDLFMPVLDGAHVLNWLRKTQQSCIYVVVMTAMTDIQTEQNILSAGANKVIKKPLDMKTLLSAVKEFINN